MLSLGRRSHLETSLPRWRFSSCQEKDWKSDHKDSGDPICFPRSVLVAHWIHRSTSEKWDGTRDRQQTQNKSCYLYAVSRYTPETEIQQNKVGDLKGRGDKWAHLVSIATGSWKQHCKTQWNTNPFLPPLPVSRSNWEQLDLLWACGHWGN